jgi:predicted RNase H-like HicB family nuclease
MLFVILWKRRVQMKIKVQLVPEDIGGFSVFVPGFPGCMSQGETEAEAITNISEALAMILEMTNSDAAEGLPHIKEIDISL